MDTKTIDYKKLVEMVIDSVITDPSTWATNVEPTNYRTLMLKEIQDRLNALEMTLDIPE